MPKGAWGNAYAKETVTLKERRKVLLVFRYCLHFACNFPAPNWPYRPLNSINLFAHIPNIFLSLSVNSPTAGYWGAEAYAEGPPGERAGHAGGIFYRAKFDRISKILGNSTGAALDRLPSRFATTVSSRGIPFFSASRTKINSVANRKQNHGEVRIESICQIGGAGRKIREEERYGRERHDVRGDERRQGKITQSGD